MKQINCLKTKGVPRGEKGFHIAICSWLMSAAGVDMQGCAAARYRIDDQIDARMKTDLRR